MQRRLGRGLDFLLSGGAPETKDGEVLHVEVARVRPNPFQPRRDFAPEELEELAASIREHGVLQPIVLREVEDGYELIAGERRLRACQRLGLATVPALVREATDTQMLELALIENLQRQDLNAIEIARGYAAYIQRLDLTQEEAARRLGKSRPAVANMLRLLDLPGDLQDLVSRGALTMGHARALLGLGDVERQRALAHRVEAERLSVREVEDLVGRAERPVPAPPPGVDEPQSHMEDLEDRLQQHLGTKVRIRQLRGRGRITIEYFSPEDLDRLLGLLLE